MYENQLEPKFIYPVNQVGVGYNPNIARFIMSENPVKKGSTIMLGDVERTVRYTEDLTLLVFPTSGKLRITRNYMIIDTGGAVDKFIRDLGFSDRRSFVRCTFDKFTYDQSAAKRKLLLHHFYSDQVNPPI